MKTARRLNREQNVIATLSRPKRLTREQAIARDEEFPATDSWGSRKAVCRRCHCVMNDCEPMDLGGEFYHPSLDKAGKPHKCVNSGKNFNTTDSELEPFLRKRERRVLKRLNGII
jgi:hypothetical protein